MFGVCVLDQYHLISWPLTNGQFGHSTWRIGFNLASTGMLQKFSLLHKTIKLSYYIFKKLPKPTTISCHTSKYDPSNADTPCCPVDARIQSIDGTTQVVTSGNVIQTVDNTEIAHGGKTPKQDNQSLQRAATFTWSNSLPSNYFLSFIIMNSLSSSYFLSLSLLSASTSVLRYYKSKQHECWCRCFL